MKRGKKIHWSVKGLNYAPCGFSTTYYQGVSIDEFGKLEEKQRCSRCNNAYSIHMRGFLYPNKIYQHKIYQHNSPLTVNMLVMSCTYATYSNNPYQKMHVEYVDFSDDFTYIKRNGGDWTYLYLKTGIQYRDNEIMKSPEQMKNIKRLIKLL